MKLKAIAAVCACVIASQVHAVNPATTLASGTNHLFVSGSSALQLTIGQAAAALFAPGTIDVYVDSATNGANFRAYSGTFKSGIAGITGGTNGVFYEMAKGGSLMGVAPVLKASAANLGLPAAQILDLNTCTSAGKTDANSGGNLWTCAGQINAAPDVGFTDIEPAFFSGINVPAGTAGISGSGGTTWLDSLLTLAVFAQPMGVILTNNMTNNSLTKGEVVGLASSLSSDWSYVDSSFAPGRVTICRGKPGSGTQAVFNNYFMGYPCSPSAVGPAVHMAGGAYNMTIIENDSSGTLAKCMGYAQNGTPPGQTIDITSGAVSAAAPDATHIVLSAGGQAMGMMRLSRPSRDPVAEPYHFVSLGYNAPTVENVVNGAYDFVSMTYWSIRRNTVNGIAPLSGAQLAFNDALRVASGNKSILGAAKVPSVPGIAALADPVNLNYDPATTVYNGQTILLNPVMRLSQSNSCQPLMQVQ